MSNSSKSDDPAKLDKTLDSLFTKFLPGNSSKISRADFNKQCIEAALKSEDGFFVKYWVFDKNSIDHQLKNPSDLLLDQILSSHRATLSPYQPFFEELLINWHTEVYEHPHLEYPLNRLKILIANTQLLLSRAGIQQLIHSIGDKLSPQEEIDLYLLLLKSEEKVKGKMDIKYWTDFFEKQLFYESDSKIIVDNIHFIIPLVFINRKSAPRTAIHYIMRIDHTGDFDFNFAPRSPYAFIHKYLGVYLRHTIISYVNTEPTPYKDLKSFINPYICKYYQLFETVLSHPSMEYHKEEIDALPENIFNSETSESELKKIMHEK